MYEALKARIVGASKSARAITQEEGMLLQMSMHALNETHSLVPMPHTANAIEDHCAAVKEEVEKRADEVRTACPHAKPHTTHPTHPTLPTPSYPPEPQPSP